MVFGAERLLKNGCCNNSNAVARFCTSTWNSESKLNSINFSRFFSPFRYVPLNTYLKSSANLVTGYPTMQSQVSHNLQSKIGLSEVLGLDTAVRHLSSQWPWFPMTKCQLFSNRVALKSLLEPSNKGFPPKKNLNKKDMLTKTNIASHGKHAERNFLLVSLIFVTYIIHIFIGSHDALVHSVEVSEFFCHSNFT